MFVTKEEIEARLASDDNLLVTLLKDRDETSKDSPEEKEIQNESESETSSANNIESVEGELVSDNDVRLSRIVDESLQEQSTRDGRNTRSGRPRDAINRSTEQRADIALMGQVLGHGLAADLLGISTASSSLHSRGKVSQDDEVDLDLVKTTKRKLNKIRNQAATGIITLLDNMDKNQLLEKVNTAKDAVAIAGQLAGIVQRVTPKEEDIKPTAQFIIVQPQVNKIENYEVVNV